MRRYGRMAILVALALAAGAGVWPKLWAPPGQHKHYLHQARAFCQGRLDIDEPFGDVATYNGRHYVVFPPFPALLITPLVAIFGVQTRTTVVSLALTALNVLVLHRALALLEVPRELRRWVLAAFFLGTAYTTSLFQTYETWHFAHIVAVTCLLLAVCEALGRGRAVLIGLFCGLAFLSRHLCLYAAPFLALAIWQRHPTATLARKLAHLTLLCLPLALCGGVYFGFNYLRFGDPLDTGYAHLQPEGFLAERVAQYGLFDLAYVPFNLTHMFLQGFHINFGPPRYLSVEGMDPLGTSVTFASPFLFLAVLARGRRAWLIPAWLAIGLPIVHAALYYNNGFAQANAQRFTLDYLPILILLVARGAQRAAPRWWKPAMAYSIALNAVALIGVDLLRRITASL